MKTRIDPRALTRELLAFNTINPPGMERACARHLGAILEAAGFRTAYHEFAEARTSLIAEIGGDPRSPADLLHRPHRHRAAGSQGRGRGMPSRARPTATACTAAAPPT